MIISHKYKFIFIKTRKTAGSTIEMFLDKYLDEKDISTGSDIDNLPSRNINVDGHLGWRYIKEKYPTEWNNYFKFAVERNPWDGVVSKYFWYKKVKPKKAKKSFEEFVYSPKLSSLNDWKLYATADQIIVDKVVKYENLHDFFLNQNIIPYNNEMLTTFIKSDTRPIKGYKHLYNYEMKKIVADEFKRQIDFLKYEF